jgi:hypothetical protein
VYKEMALQGQDIDVVYLNGWVAVFQFILCIPLAYPSAYATALPVNELWPNIYDGMWCFLGYSSTHPDGTVDQCGMAPVFVSIYILFNIAFNVLIILILKYGSANIMFMGSTALVPMTNALFACPFIPGHMPLKPTDFAGLAVIMAGITVYRFVKRLPLCDDTPDSDGEDSSDDDEDLAKPTARKHSPGGAAKKGLYIGLNSMAAETIQPLLKTRVILAKARRGMNVRLPERPHTRSPYLSRLGIAPSPRFTTGPGTPGRTPPAPGQQRLAAGQATPPPRGKRAGSRGSAV